MASSHAAMASLKESDYSEETASSVIFYLS